jgi:hypothetical protein
LHRLSGYTAQEWWPPRRLPFFAYRGVEPYPAAPRRFRGLAGPSFVRLQPSLVAHPPVSSNTQSWSSLAGCTMAGTASFAFPRPSDLLRRPRRSPVCGLCRCAFTKAQPRTRDHVIPEGFFNDPKPNNLPTWAVCRPCQDTLKLPEERLRNIFVAAPSHHADELVSVTERAKRSTQPPVPQTWRYVTTEGGVLVHAPIVVPKQADLDAVFRKMAWGLFTWKHHRLPPASSPFVVRLMSAEAFGFWTHTLNLPVQGLGSEVSWMSHSDEEMSHGVWLFMLHGAVPVGVWCGHATKHPRIPSPSAIALRLDRQSWSRF